MFDRYALWLRARRNVGVGACATVVPRALVAIIKGFLIDSLCILHKPGIILEHFIKLKFQTDIRVDQARLLQVIMKAHKACVHLVDDVGQLGSAPGKGGYGRLFPLSIRSLSQTDLRSSTLRWRQLGVSMGDGGVGGLHLRQSGPWARPVADHAASCSAEHCHQLTVLLLSRQRV